MLKRNYAWLKSNTLDRMAYNKGHWHSWSSVVRKLATTIAKVWVQISLMLLQLDTLRRKIMRHSNQAWVYLPIVHKLQCTLCITRDILTYLPPGSITNSVMIAACQICREIKGYFFYLLWQ